jgi:hypothetical protein
MSCARYRRAMGLGLPTAVSRMGIRVFLRHRSAPTLRSRPRPGCGRRWNLEFRARRFGPRILILWLAVSLWGSLVALAQTDETTN